MPLSPWVLGWGGASEERAGRGAPRDTGGVLSPPHSPGVGPRWTSPFPHSDLYPAGFHPKEAGPSDLTDSLFYVSVDAWGSFCLTVPGSHHVIIYLLLEWCPLRPLEMPGVDTCSSDALWPVF